MEASNRMELCFTSVPQNEAFARMVISAFVMQANPIVSIVSEIRTAVSEAVTNAIVHGYEEHSGTVILRARLDGEQLEIEIEDFGYGIDDVQQAMQPFFTTHPEQERTGIGFALMQSFMDTVKVTSSRGCGTLVRMTKKLDDTV